MADKAISELVAAEQIKSTDMFVLEQDGTAKRLQGQTLLNWLTAAADGHGGISNIAKTGTDGLVDTYTITLADTTTKTFTVTNGNGLTNFEKLSTVGLVDNYRFTRTDGTFFDFSVYNGAKGDKGDDSHVWIKYASQQPTADSHSMGDLPDAWMGVYSGTAAEAPDDWQQYTWYQIKGEKGDTGAAATVTGTTVEYMVSDSGTIVPSGSWSTVIPTVPQGKYLWTRVTTTFNTGSPAVSYSVTRMGLDGTGSVSTVNDKSPNESGNVTLTATDITTSGGGSVQAALDDKQETLTPGENISISGSVIATKAFPCNPNLLDNEIFQVWQRYPEGTYTGVPDMTYIADRWMFKSSDGSITNTITKAGYYGIKNASGPNVRVFQRLENAAQYNGKLLTLSVLKGDGSLPSRTVVASGWTETTDIFAVFAHGLEWLLTGDTWLAAKLELGTQQTLAHQENGVWVLNEIPNYGEQLRRCRRYLRPAGYNFIVSNNSAGNWYGSTPFSNSEPMRAVPVIVNGDYKPQPVRDVTGGQCATIDAVFTPGIYGQFTVQLSPLGSTIPNYVYIDSSGFNPLLSAEL
jgi:hypothetical protein